MNLPDHWFYGRASDVQDCFVFDAEEALHATKVLRLRAGDALQWLDGAGARLTGTIGQVERGGFSAFAKTRVVEPIGLDLHLAVGALHDSTRLEWLIEKATELGASRISLLQTQRVQRTRHRLARLEAKAVAAMKQSGRTWLPHIVECSFDESLAAFAQPPHAQELRLIAHCYPEAARARLTQVLANFQTDRGTSASRNVILDAGETPSAVLFIGPEGDFTLEEVRRAELCGFEAVHLGQARLRTETAAVAALAAIMLALEA